MSGIIRFFYYYKLLTCIIHKPKIRQKSDARETVIPNFYSPKGEMAMIYST